MRGGCFGGKKGEEGEESEEGEEGEEGEGGVRREDGDGRGVLAQKRQICLMKACVEREPEVRHTELEGGRERERARERESARGT